MDINNVPLSTNQGTSDKRSLSRTIPYDGHVVVKFVVQGSAKIKVNIRNILSANLFEETVTNDTSWTKSNASMDEGWHVDLTITPLQNNTNYTIQVWIE